MADFTIDIQGIPEVKEFLKTKNKKLGINIQKGINQSAIYVQGEVKMSISGNRAEKKSVDTGRFLNSVSVKTGPLQSDVYTNVSYGKFLEFGTSKFPARSHFRNSANRSTDKVINIIKEKAKEGVD